MTLFIFPQNIIYPSSQLELTMMLLEDWSIVYIDGEDSQKYLQNQLTIDVNKLEKIHHKICAHCNFNGKVWSTMHIFHYKKGYAYIHRKSVCNTQRQELKKYSIFSKVTIKKLDDIYLLGISGKEAKLFLLNFFLNVPNEFCSVLHENEKYILWFSDPIERFLLILNKSDFLFFHSQINKKIFLSNSQQWLALNIEASIPVIDKDVSIKFMPQAINLDKLHAISFNKGCYYGQETIARIFFKKLNKHCLCFLFGAGVISPKIGSLIETQRNKQWYKIGFLLSIVHIRHEEIWIQVVLRQPINTDSVFRIYGFKNTFIMKNKI